MKVVTTSLTCALLLSTSVATSFAPQSSAHLPSTAAPSDPSSIPVAVASGDGEGEGAVQSSPSFMGPNAVSPGFLRRTLPALPWHRLPNWLTYMRCMAIPGLVWLFYQKGRHVETSALFAFASFTDWLDGYLARRWDIASPFGEFLDPVADKLMVSTALVLLAGRYGAPVAIPTAIILAREISVSALREWMAQRGQRDIVKVGFQGKLKTALTMIALTMMMAVPTEGADELRRLSMGLIYFCAGITVTSGSVYFRAAAPILFKSQQS